MSRYLKKALSFMLALMLAVTGMTTMSQPATVMAAESASMTTETIDDPVEATINADVYFVHKATGKLVTINGVKGDPIECITALNGKDVPANGLFKIFYGKYGEKKVVNFTNKQTNTSWKADENNVFQMDKWDHPSGWESVQIEPQGDGTICFKSSANDKYFTVKDGKLQLTNLNDGEEPSPNERFILHTDTKPKTAKAVTLSDISGDCVTVSWKGVSESLFSGYEVLYSTGEAGPFTSAGTTGKTTLNVTDLRLNTKYFFKVRTFTNYDDNVYADSKMAYAVTLKERKPSKPSNVRTEEKDGKLVVSWNKANNASSYNVYRADSRFAEYKLVKAGITDTTYVEESPNSNSKFNNYYKIQAANSETESEFSDLSSLEISMFGQNTYVFNETDDPQKIQETTQSVFVKQRYNQFGKNRFALAYKPGNYVDAGMVNIGYYTYIHGLGKTPTDTQLYNVNTPSALSGNNATCNFWVGIENVQIEDVENNNGDVNAWFQWGVSQAAPARRLNVLRKAHFQWQWDGWCSGGYIADCKFAKQVGSFSQQQYYYRNSDFDETIVEEGGKQGAVYGVNWNQVIQGCDGVNKEVCQDNSSKKFSAGTSLINNNGYTNWNQRGCTTVIEKTDAIREKPFLYFDTASDRYKVFVPALRKNATGISWSENNIGEGTSIDVEKNFYIANPDEDTADTINHQLEIGKNIIFQPGIYHVDKPIKVDEPNTILLGLGMATIIPDNKEAAIKTADVGGLAICGLILDAGNYSETLLTVGEEGCNKNHKNNPSVIQDVFYRVGGTGDLGRCTSCEVINSNDVIVDHTWIWRADHGDNTGWYDNTAKNGIVVNGDDVTCYGLFVEHFQEYDILWRGENGKTYFLQNEKCYDPQSQDGWMSHNGTKKGYAAYKVTNNVKNHYAVGMGVYDVFIYTNGASIYLDSAIEVPDTPNVLIENACITEIAAGDGPKVGINHIINGTTAGIRTGAGQGSADVKGGYAIQRLLNYSNKASRSLPDYYEVQKQYGNIGSEPAITEDKIVKEVGTTPTNDPDAEKNIKKDQLTEDKAYPTTSIWNMTDDDYKAKQDYCYDKWLNGKKDPTDEPDDPKGPNVKDDDATYVYKTYGVKVGGVYTIGKYIYKVTSVTRTSGKATVTGVAPKYKAGMKTASIPAAAKYHGYVLNATAVGAKAFRKLKKLSKVTFGKNVKKIGASAFASCPKLKTIKFKNVTGIGSKAFYNCKSIKKVTIGNKVTTIGKNAFAKCKKITQVTFGKKVKKINAKAFINSKKLKKIIFKGKKLNKIAKNVFAKSVRKKVKITAKNKKVRKKVLKSLKRKK